MKNILVTFVILGLVAAVHVGNAQTQKIGFVSSAKIFKELPEAQDAQAKIDAMKKTVQDELEKKGAELQAKYEEYQKKESMMTDPAKKQAQDEIVDLQRKFEQLKVEKLGDNSDLVKNSEKILEPLRAKVIKAIERVAKDEKYSMVLDRTEPVSVLLYGEAAHDLTYKVIDRLKRGK